MNSPADAGDVSARLYRAALGPDPEDRYLCRFRALDAGTPAPRSWHGGACASALGWLAWRGLYAVAALWACTALLGSVLVLGLARLLFGADAGQLALLLLALAMLASLAWGLGAERLYHRICTRRILQAVAAHDSIAAACEALSHRQPGRAARWALLLLVTAPSLALLAGLGRTLQPPALGSAPAATPTVAVVRPPAPAPIAEAAAPALPTASMPGPAAVPDEAGTAAPAAEAPAAAAPVAQAAVQATPVAQPPAAAAPTAAPPIRSAQGADRHSSAASYAVQIGVFAQADNARAAQARLSGAGLAVQVDPLDGQGHQRVRSGPYTTQAQAQRAAERIRALGLPAVVVRLPAARD